MPNCAHALTVLSAMLLLVCGAGAGDASGADGKPAAKAAIRWEKWSDDVWQRAKKEQRFVLLDLEAVWCHWCHVMEEKTYSDPEVARLIGEKYIAVRVDQDSRPDLSNRYEDYGWPATVVFDADGKELVKRSGYIPPKPMARLLQAIIDDPTPGPSVQPETAIQPASDSALPDGLRKDLLASHLERYDAKEGGWGFSQKYLDWDCVEYALLLAARGDAQAERMARETLAKAQAHLIDPVWGGIYQYSTDGVWTEQHFEKIMSYQAESLRVYALAYGLWRDPEHLRAARDIERFLRGFLLGPEGAFYTSQDADVVKGEHSAEYFRLNDAERRKIGVPAVDRNQYARENGWAINALATLYAVSGDEKALDTATAAARWIEAQRGLEGGGFRHGVADAAGPYLNDTLAMARAYTMLYGVTGGRNWLARAEAAAQFIQSNFGQAGGSGGGDAPAGFVTARASDAANPNLAPKPQRDENVMLARVARRLFHYTGKAEYERMARQAMRIVCAPSIARRHPAAAVLLADDELRADPAHVTVVGAKDSPEARALFGAANRQPLPFRRVEWFDRAEGALPNSDVAYPQLGGAAAFLCAGGRCSIPLRTPEALSAKLANGKNR